MLQMEKQQEINNKAVEVIKKMIESPLFFIEKMWGLGTPEDLKYYLENKK